MNSRILYIEDNPLNMNLIRKMIKMMGYEFLSAVDGQEGLRVAGDELPDLILLDINLPDMDGHEVYRQLRNNPSLANIPIIALTADINTYYQCLSTGFDSYLNKPVSKSAVMKTILQHLQ